MGAWIGVDRVKNQKEIDSLIELAKNGHVDIAVVGNEVLLRNDLIEEGVLSYLNEVKKELPNIPVTYSDAYYKFIEYPELIEACDILMINCYPFWEGTSIDLATASLRSMYDLIRSKANGKEVIISETGWPDDGQVVENAQPSELNAMKYFINTNKWAKEQNVPLIYFSSFDESWKVHHEGDVGESWGIWDKDNILKYQK